MGETLRWKHSKDTFLHRLWFNLHPPKTGSKLTRRTLLTETGQFWPDVFLTWQRLRPGSILTRRNVKDWDGSKMTRCIFITHSCIISCIHKITANPNQLFKKTLLSPSFLLSNGRSLLPHTLVFNFDLFFVIIGYFDPSQALVLFEGS